MCQPVVGKRSTLRHCCIHCCYLTRKQRRTVMKKSAHTPDPTMSDQAPESGSSRAVTIPTGPVKIFSATDGTSYLYFRDGRDNELRITRASSPPPNSLWTFERYTHVDYYIKSYQSSLYITATDRDDLVAEARVGASTHLQVWYIAEAGGGLVSISKYGYPNRVFTLGSSGAEGSPVYLDYDHETTHQKFRLGT